MTTWVFDTNDANFEADVLTRSQQTPVLVDFWAPWCGPCRTLGPLLDRLATEEGGRFVVAKVNVDENPGLARAFRIQSIPRMVGFRDGQMVVDQVGALPERELRMLLARLLPSHGEELARQGEQSLAAGDPAAAEQLFRESLEIEPRCGLALIGLARLEEQRGELDSAMRLLEQVPPGALSATADKLAAEIRVRQAGGGDEAALQAKVTANPADLDARLLLGRSLAARGAYEDSLRELLEVVRRDRNFRDGEARKAMLDLFELIGPRTDIVERYRGELAKLLFS